LRAGAGAAPEFFLGFAFDDLSAVYVRDMPPIEAASGHASIDDNRFVLYLEQGYVDAAQGGRVDISGSSFAIPDIRIRRGPAPGAAHNQWFGHCGPVAARRAAFFAF